MITVEVNGVFAVVFRAVTGNPAGEEASLSPTVFGSSRTLFVSVSPCASVAVSLSSRYDGYS